MTILVQVMLNCLEFTKDCEIWSTKKNLIIHFLRLAKSSLGKVTVLYDEAFFGVCIPGHGGVDGGGHPLL